MTHREVWVIPNSSSSLIVCKLILFLFSQWSVLHQGLGCTKRILTKDSLILAFVQDCLAEKVDLSRQVKRNDTKYIFKACTIRSRYDWWYFEKKIFRLNFKGSAELSSLEFDSCSF